jgi:hypothetical protein
VRKVCHILIGILSADYHLTNFEHKLLFERDNNFFSVKEGRLHRLPQQGRGCGQDTHTPGHTGQAGG